MSIRKLRAGRVPSVTASQYVGERGSIFWNESTGELRLSDGVTLGGSPVGFPVASSSVLGGIKLGPGVILNGDNQVIIDSTGLNFNFGDLQATTPPNGAATLSTINTDQDIALVTNGTGTINVVGNFHVHTTATYNPSQPDTDGAVFAVKADGQIQMKIPLADVTSGALEIVGNDTGLFLAPNQTGVILHVTGNSGLVARNYFDANGNYVLLGGRRYNGTQINPTRVLNGQIMLRVIAQGAAATGSGPATFQTFGPARIEFVATEDQTPTAQGGEVRILATPNGSAATGTGTLVATFNATTGVTATKFVGPLTGNVTGKADTAGNADTVTNGVYTNGSYANPAWITSLAASKVGLGNVTNESKATMFTSPTFTGTTSGITATMVGLGDVTNESKATMFTSPTFTGTVAGVTKAMVGLGSVENTALSTSTYYIGTTQNTYGRASAAQTLTGVSISGNAGTVTNGVYTSDTGTVTNTMLAGSIANNKLANSTISGVSLGGNLLNLTAGYGLSFSAGTTYNGSTAVTLNRYEGVSTPTATGSGGNGWTYSLDLGTSTGLTFLNVGGNFSGTVTLTGTPVVGRITRLVIVGGIKGATVVTVSGLTAGNSSNGTNTFLATSNTASTVIVEFYSSTTALSGVYMNCSGAK